MAFHSSLSRFVESALKIDKLFHQSIFHYHRIFIWCSCYVSLLSSSRSNKCKIQFFAAWWFFSYSRWIFHYFVLCSIHELSMLSTSLLSELKLKLSTRHRQLMDKKFQEIWRGNEQLLVTFSRSFHIPDLIILEFSSAPDNCRVSPSSSCSLVRGKCCACHVEFIFVRSTWSQESGIR